VRSLEVVKTMSPPITEDLVRFAVGFWTRVGVASIESPQKCSWSSVEAG